MNRNWHGKLLGCEINKVSVLSAVHISKLYPLHLDLCATKMLGCWGAHAKSVSVEKNFIAFVKTLQAF